MRTSTVKPEFVEIEQFRRSVNQKLWVAIGGLVLVAAGALGLAVIALARPIPVVVFDGDWRPVLFEDTVSPRLKLEEERVKAFAEQFLARFSLVDSMDLEEDMEEATAMMTPRLRRIFLADTAELDRRSKLEHANLKGRFESLTVEAAPFDAEDLNARILLVAYGRVGLRPKLQAAWEQEREETQYIHAQVVLERVPITRSSIHGLQVDHVKTWWFDTADALEVHRLKEAGR